MAEKVGEKSALPLFFQVMFLVCSECMSKHQQFMRRKCDFKPTQTVRSSSNVQGTVVVYLVSGYVPTLSLEGNQMFITTDG